MDVTDLRKIFGEMPIEMLSSAQMLQKKKTRNFLWGLTAVAAFAAGVYVTYQFMKERDEAYKPEKE